MTHPRVHIGIVTFRSKRLIRRCLDAVLGQTYKNITVTVLDNASGDGIRSALRRYGKKIRYIQGETNAGYGGGHNAIIRSVSLRDRDFYLTLNPDAVLDARYIETLSGSLAKHQADWATGKLIRNKGAKELYSAGHAIFRDGYAFNIGYGTKDTGQYDDSREVFGAPGAAALYSGRLIRSISVNGVFFDPAFFMYYEDIDVDWRAQRAGFSCWYDPRAVAVHRGGTFPRRLEPYVLSNRFLTVMKNAEIRDVATYNAWVIIAHVFMRLLCTPRTGFRTVQLLVSRLPGILAVRKDSVVGRIRMHRWFARAAREVSGQPRSFLQRLSVFMNRGGV